MKRLYAPWRHDYVTKTSKSKTENASSQDCVFCTQFVSGDDNKAYIVKRFDHCVVMMNFYPYNIGHIMVLPYEHRPTLHDLTRETRTEMMEVVTLSMVVIGKIMKTEGFNVGINLGIAGGGGIPSHVHIHVLPRWRGDTNFLETIGHVKLLSTDFEQSFKDLKDGFSDVIL
jgi:ATP adenylyltransferase